MPARKLPRHAGCGETAGNRRKAQKAARELVSRGAVVAIGVSAFAGGGYLHSRGLNMITSSELIGEFLKLKKEIEKDGASGWSDAIYKILNTIVKIVEMELKHRELQAQYPDIRVKFFDEEVSPDPVTAENVKQIRKASKEVRVAMAERKKAEG